MESRPRYSVVISSYNSGPYLKYAVRSILANGRSDVEILVVDDGSTDHSIAEAEQIEDPSVRVVRKPNGGQASAFNAGFEASSGEVICLLDGDDFFLPDKLDELDRLLREHDLLGSSFFLRHPLVRVGTINDPARLAGNYAFSYYSETMVSGAYGRLVPLGEPALVDAYIERNGFPEYLGGNATVMSRATAEACFPLPESLSKHYGDLYPVLGAQLVAKTYFYGSPLAAYRFHGENHSSIRPKSYSPAFLSGVDRYLEDVARRNGRELKLDHERSAMGVRTLINAGRRGTAIRHALLRARLAPNRRNLRSLVSSLVTRSQ